MNCYKNDRDAQKALGRQKNRKCVRDRKATKTLCHKLSNLERNHRNRYTYIIIEENISTLHDKHSRLSSAIFISTVQQIETFFHELLHNLAATPPRYNVSLVQCHITARLFQCNVTFLVCYFVAQCIRCVDNWWQGHFITLLFCC